MQRFEDLSCIQALPARVDTVKDIAQNTFISLLDDSRGNFNAVQESSHSLNLRRKGGSVGVISQPTKCAPEIKQLGQWNGDVATHIAWADDLPARKGVVNAESLVRRGSFGVNGIYKAGDSLLAVNYPQCLGPHLSTDLQGTDDKIRCGSGLLPQQEAPKRISTQNAVEETEDVHGIPTK